MGSCLDKCLKNGGALSFNEDKYNAVLNVTGSNLLMVESMDTELKIFNEIKGIKQANELETKNIKEDIDELKNILSEIDLGAKMDERIDDCSSEACKTDPSCVDKCVGDVVPDLRSFRF